jgi:hypothetical protein
MSYLSIITYTLSIKTSVIRCLTDELNQDFLATGIPIPTYFKAHIFTLI